MSNSFPKPKYLTLKNAARFKEQDVVDRYHLRLPYPPEVFTILADLITDEPRNLLDVGTGLGEIAREMAKRMARVDAVDVSATMLARAKTMPDGEASNINWLQGMTEEVALNPPYALITAADSMHWMNWEAVFPRFRSILTSNGFVALVHRKDNAAWQTELTALIARYTAKYGYEDFDLIMQLEQRDLFKQVGGQNCSVTSLQSLEDYINSFHSRSSLTIDYMTPEIAAQFDAELLEIVKPYSKDNFLQLETLAEIVWGKPL
jgi:trans-aconitate methyltransferase